MQLNPTLAQLPVYVPGRPIEEVARELGLAAADIIKLASNENPLGPSPLALAAMQAALAQVHLYPDGSAFALKERLAAHFQLSPGHLILGNGSNELIEFLGHALLRPGAEVVVSQYCFAVYPIVTHLFGATLVTVPARAFGHDLDAMLRAITPQTAIVFVANPNNPTGTLADPAALLRFVQAVPPHVLIALDEAYVEFLDAPPDLLALVRSGAVPNLLLLRTCSKIHGLAGVRLGYGLGQPDFIAALEKVRQPFNLNSIAQAGALAALGDTAHMEATRRNNRAGLDCYTSACAALGLETVPSAANFLMVRVGDGPRVCAELQRLGVIVRPLAGYQLPEWIRISIGTPAENERCLAALKQVLAAR